MAVTRAGKAINMTAAADAVSGTLRIQSMWAGAAGTLQSGGVTVWQATAAGQFVVFPETLELQGMTKSAGSGNFFVYLA